MFIANITRYYIVIILSAIKLIRNIARKEKTARYQRVIDKRQIYNS